MPGQQDKCFLCGQVGHLAASCEGKAKRKSGEFDEKGEDTAAGKKPFQVLKLFMKKSGCLIHINYSYLCH